MGRLRKYGEFPLFLVPDEGEIVLASKSPAGPFLRAAVLTVRRASRDQIRVSVMWLESSPVSASGSGAEEGTQVSIYVHKDDSVPLVRRLPAPGTRAADTAA